MDEIRYSGLRGKVAVVTGASSGIGRAVALSFAREGVKVVVADVTEGSSVVQEVRDAGSEAVFARCDVSKSADVQAMVRLAVETYGRLDFACNNAGIGGEANLIADYSEEGWNKVIAINLTGVFLCMKYEIPEILKQGGGAIVNMASILGHVGFPASAAYVAAKHGLLGLTQNAALEYSAQGLRVTAVCPAFIKTPLIENNMSDEARAGLIALHPIGRLGEPPEVAELVVWLCSDAATFITGNPILVDGGYVAR